ncbi:hypothetical protein [Natrinema salinisoli]|uniref:hypothetical protein n=1 Tax=Natrinema salinisoli TaxID=2878535 RepID=UPI001CEFB573|nr:hypothetical protein [Natrinema salinisoli]
MTGSKDDLVPSPLVIGLIDKLLSGDEVDLEVRDIEILENTSYNAFFHYVDGGSFYRIGEKTLEKGTVTGLKYEVSRSGTEQDISEEDVLPMSDLPYHDQWLLHDSLSISDTGGVIPFSDTLVAGYLDSDYQANSLLVDGIDEQFIKFSDRYIKLEEEGEHSSSIERVRYTAELVGEDPISFGEYVTKRYAVKASDLSTDAHDLLDRIDESD